MVISRTHRGGLVGPVIVICAGVLFLLNNFGIVDWSVWLTLLRLWPVLLIAAGLDILIGRRSWVGSAVVALLIVAVLVVAVSGALNTSGIATGAAVERTETVRAELKGAERGDVEIGFGTGALTVSALPADSGDLLTGTLDLSRNERLDQSQSNANGRARVSLHSGNDWATGMAVPRAGEKQWEIALNRDVPLNLKFDNGLGQSNLDLTQLQLTRLEVNGGVGSVTVKLPERGRFDVAVDGGVGQVTIIIPESLAARVTVDSGLGSTQMPEGFEKRDNEYTSPGFASAGDRAEIRVNGGIGRIIVRQTKE